MYLFKYYRPDYFFDKAIRYNEFYFSSGAQLNDPNDLNIDYRFDNNLSFWDFLLNSSCEYSYKKLRHLLNLDDQKIHKELNKLFKGIRIKGSLDSLNDLFERHNVEISDILNKYLLPSSYVDIEDNENQVDKKRNRVKQCEDGIKERLYKKITPGIFSVSFSSKALERMMWVHYAAGFSGCVVIYKVEEDSSDSNHNFKIVLKDNLFSLDRFPVTVKPITYSNVTKEISILDPLSNITDLVLTKNRFWRYESEYRMFLSEMNIGIEGEKLIKDTVNRNGGHVFHHENNTMKGIIFGPRMSKLKKEEIWQVIKSHVMNTDSDSFYFFDAVLSSSGKIDILNGKIAKKKHGYDLYQEPLTQDELQNALNMFEISNE